MKNKQKKQPSKTYFWSGGYQTVGPLGMYLEPHDRTGRKVGTLIANERNLYVRAHNSRRWKPIRWDRAIEKLLT